MSRSKVPRLFSLLYTHNPFYLISACLFVYGLKLLFRAGDSTVLFQQGSVAYMEPWGLMASFAGVAVLMAVTAVMVVRFGRVWEDARSLVLNVLLMLLAMSVSFDEIITLLSDRDNAQLHLFRMFATGVCFAVGLCELLIRGLRIRLLLSYRLPLYGFIVLFFAWPALLLPELTGFTKPETRWLIAAFPLSAAALTLMLIPAVRRGSKAVADNGTPWKWPLFPWTPFVFIALAVCFRSYTLTMSFDVVSMGGHYWDTMFGLYLLVPFALAVFAVLLEISVVEGRPGLQRGVMLTAPLLLILATPALAPWSKLGAYSSFTLSLTDTVGSPVFLTMIGLAGFYGYAWLRGVRRAEFGVYSTAALSAMIDPRGFGTSIWELRPDQLTWWPVLVLAVLQIAIGVYRKQSMRVFAGLMLGILAGHFAASGISQLFDWRSVISVHAVLLAVVLTGGCFKDGFAQAMNELGPVLLSGTMTWAFAVLLQRGVSPQMTAAYCGAMTALAFALNAAIGNRLYFVLASIHCGIGVMGAMGYSVVSFFRASLPDGMKPVLLAVLSFLLAVFISALKSGLSRRIRMCWIRRRRRSLTT